MRASSRALADVFRNPALRRLELADRLPRRAVMISADLVRAALVVFAAGLIFSDGPALLVYVLAIVTSLTGTPFRPAQAALLPSRSATAWRSTRLRRAWSRSRSTVVTSSRR